LWMLCTYVMGGHVPVGNSVWPTLVESSRASSHAGFQPALGAYVHSMRALYARIHNLW